MADKPSPYNTCPKCGKTTATSEIKADGSGRFYCSAPGCGFSMETQKQDMGKNQMKLEDIKSKLFGGSS